MTLHELTPEQIAALATGIAAVIAAVGGLAYRAAYREPPPATKASTAGSLLVLDAEQAKALANALGLSTVEMVALAKAIQANTQASQDLGRRLAGVWADTTELREDSEKIQDLLIRIEDRTRDRR